ncbi:MAG: hypothetical protein ACRBCI_13215 [Cellvibrionaceae bacterium]
MIRKLYKIFIFINALVLSLVCSAQIVPKDPNNQLIEGPFSITPEWQTIKFSNPLKSSPYIQTLEVLLKIDDYENIEGLELSQYRISYYGYKRVADSMVVKPEVILVDQKNREYRATFNVTGASYTPLGNYYLLGYGVPGQGEYYFPQETKFVAVKIRANVEVKVEHLQWIASGYFKAPERTWADIHPNDIVDIK